MLFPALLLIIWGALMVRATSLLSSSQHIRTRIPIRTMPTPIPKNSPEINPSLIFNSQESMITSSYRSRHSLKVADFRKVPENTRSFVNPNTGNVDSKVLLQKGIRNSPLGFRSYRGGRDVPGPTNMNNPSQDNVGVESKMTHLSRSEDPGDQHMKQAEKGNSTFQHDDDYYYSSSLPEKMNAFSQNDNLSHLFHAGFRELQIFSTEKEENESEKNAMSSPTLLANVKPSSADGENAIHKNSTVSNSYNRSYNNSTKKIHRNDEKNFGKETSFNLKNQTTEPIIKNRNILSNGETTVQAPIETLNTVSETNRNQKGNTNTKETSTHIAFQSTYKINNNSENATNVSYRNASKNVEISGMQQDGIFGLHTKAVESSTQLNNEFYSAEKINSKKEENKKKELLAKIHSIFQLSTHSITTPDSHMNDPPFRGPNVPSEIDNFRTIKEDPKTDFHPSHTLVKSTLFKSSNMGEEWRNAKQLGSLPWNYHCYIIGSLFTVIAAYSLISLLRIRTFITLLRTGYYVTINTIILLTCVMRAFYLLYDPYNFSEKLPSAVSHILLKVTFPSITSGFCFLILSLLSFTDTKVFSSSFQNPSVLAIVVAFLVSLVVTLEIVVHLLHLSTIFLMFSYLVIISFGSFTSISYFVIFTKLHHRALIKQGEMIRLTFTKMHIDGAQLPKKLPRPTLCLAVKLLLVISVLHIILCCMLPYTMMYLRSSFTSSRKPNPWIWWGYQLVCRILELLICGTMSFIATQPLKHFEAEENRFCRILMWFPCSTLADCFQNEEVIDFEAHSSNYANSQGLRNSGLNLIGNNRRLQTNSLPTFRTPLTEIDTNLPMRTLPCSSRHTNHASALSLLSYYRSKRALNMSKADELDDLERTLCNQSSLDTRTMFRPASMLYKDNGFIRFRRETDPEQPMEMSDEDDHQQEEQETSLEDADSTKANVGSSFHSLLDGDVVQNTLSPFFQIDYKRRFRKMSRVSIETTDYSADISSDQLSNVVNLKNGLSTSALDFHARKYGSTCSSESAANSFDVTFFLNSNSSPDVQTSPISTTPASLNIFSAYRSETEDDKTSSVEGHEVMLRSVSPIVKQSSYGRLSLNLNLHASSETNHSNGHVNVACGTEDITPDSAVYLDLHLPRDNIVSPKTPQKIFDKISPLRRQKSSDKTYLISSDDVAPLTPELDSRSPYLSSTSHSLNEIQTSNSYFMPRLKKNSRSFLCKLRGSTFSLNAAIYGYEPLEHDTPKCSKDRRSRKKLVRSSSDRRPLSDGLLDTKFCLADMRHRMNSSSSGHLGDSGLLGDCGVALVDVASQTEDNEETECMNKSHLLNSDIICDSKCTQSSQTHNSAQLIALKK